MAAKKYFNKKKKIQNLSESKQEIQTEWMKKKKRADLIWKTERSHDWFLYLNYLILQDFMEQIDDQLIIPTALNCHKKEKHSMKDLIWENSQ